MCIYEDANDACERGEWERVRELLTPGAAAGDHDAQSALGSLLTLAEEHTAFLEGVRWLRSAADAGDATAAHNLGTILLSGGPGLEADIGEAMHYLHRAQEGGLEATVSWERESEPLRSS
jgi:TPR repeat protein